MLIAVSAENTPDKYLLGDSDGDGKVTISDATLIQMHLAGLVNILDNNLPAADVDGSGSPSIRDSSALQQFISGNTGTYPINKIIVKETEKPTETWFTQGENELPFIPIK